MTPLSSFHYANARGVISAQGDDAQNLGEKIKAAFDENHLDVVHITVAIRQHKGMHLDIELSHVLPGQNGEGSATELENGIRWDFRVYKKTLLEMQDTWNEFEKIIFDNRLYPVIKP